MFVLAIFKPSFYPLKRVSRLPRVTRHSPRSSLHVIKLQGKLLGLRPVVACCAARAGNVALLQRLHDAGSDLRFLRAS